MFNPVGSKATVCAFTYTPNVILTGHESGKVALFDVATGTEVANNERAHMDTVTDLQLSLDQTYFVTSSKDKTARVSFIFHRRTEDLLISFCFVFPHSVTRYQNPTSAQDIYNGDTPQQRGTRPKQTLRAHKPSHLMWHVDQES